MVGHFLSFMVFFFVVLSSHLGQSFVYFLLLYVDRCGVSFSLLVERTHAGDPSTFSAASSVVVAPGSSVTSRACVVPHNIQCSHLSTIIAIEPSSSLFCLLNRSMEIQQSTGTPRGVDMSSVITLHKVSCASMSREDTASKHFIV